MKKKKTLKAEEIAEMADRGEDVTKFFTKSDKTLAEVIAEKKGAKSKPLRRSIDFGPEMYMELEVISSKINISVSAVIKMAIQDYLLRYNSIYHPDEKKSS